MEKLKLNMSVDELLTLIRNLNETLSVTNELPDSEDERAIRKVRQTAAAKLDWIYSIVSLTDEI